MRLRLSSTQVAVVAFVVLAAFAQIGIAGTSTAWVTASDPIVAFNTHSLKFHHPDCPHAKACTENCIIIPRSEALRRGGIPCKHCGGGMRVMSVPPSTSPSETCSS